MPACEHFFVTIKEVSLFSFPDGSPRPLETQGVLVMCPKCALRVEMYEDGTIKELHHETK